jgi:hypothetical protein
MASAEIVAELTNGVDPRLDENDEDSPFFDDHASDFDEDARFDESMEMTVDDEMDRDFSLLLAITPGRPFGTDMIDDDDLDDYAADPVADNTSQVLPVGTRMPSMTDVYGRLGNTSALTSEKAFRCLWSDWVTYCASEQRIPCHKDTGLSFYYSVAVGFPLNGTDRLDRMVQLGSSLVIDYALMNGFLAFQADKPDMNRAQFQKTGKFLRAHLKAEYSSLQNLSLKRKIPMSIEGHDKKVTTIESMSSYTRLLKEVLARKALQERQKGTDLQADKERLITDEERIELLKEVHNPTYQSVKSTSFLSRLCFAAQFNKAFQIGKRGEALRSHTFGMTYAEPYRLGPENNLMTSFVLSNRGKENSVGRRTCTGFVPHYQPLFDAAGSDGTLFLYRFGGFSRNDYCLAQKLPIFLNPVDLLNHHIYPSIKGGATVEIPRCTYQSTWSTMYKACKIVCDKVTHQPRKQVQQELDFKLCPQEYITRFAGYSEGGAGNKNQNDSYLTNEHTGVMSSVAGSPYGHKRPETHAPGYYLAYIEDLILPLMENSGLGGFVTQREDVHYEYDNCGSRKKMAEKGLFMAKGAVSYFYEAVKRAFLVAAARPMHADSGRLNRESPRIYELFKNGTGPCVYNNPVFACAEFMTLVDRVTVVQERADDNIIEISIEAENALTLAVKDNVVGPVQDLAAQVLCMNSRFDRLHDDNLHLTAEVKRLRTVLVRNNLGHVAFSEDGISGSVTPFVSPTNSVETRRLTNFSTAFMDNGMDDDMDDAMDDGMDDGVTDPRLLAEAASLVFRLASADDTLANGDPRQRKRKVDQETLAIYQRTLGIAQSRNLSTADFRSLDDIWQEYTVGDGPDRLPLRDLESKYEVAWRRDVPGTSTSKGVQWCNRTAVYALVEFYMMEACYILNSHDNTLERRPLTETEALLETNKTFLCCFGKSGKPNFREMIVPQFKRQLVYENGARGRTVCPSDEIRFIPENVRRLVKTYMDRSLTSDGAWEEAEKTIRLCLPRKENKIIVPGLPLDELIDQQQVYEDRNMGRIISKKHSRFIPTWD